MRRYLQQIDTRSFSKRNFLFEFFLMISILRTCRFELLNEATIRKIELQFELMLYISNIALNETL